MNTHHDEPGSEEILDWLEGRLSPERARVVEAAVDRPGSRAGEFAAWARDFLRLSEVMPLTTPPPVVRQRLRHLYASRSDRSRGQDRLVARLDLDSRQADPMVAVRGPLLDAGERVQLSFVCPVADIVLDIAPAGPHRVTLRGQVLPRRTMPAAFHAVAHGPRGSVCTIEGDELGGFTLEDVPTDAEVVVLTNDELTIEVPLSPDRMS